MVAVSFVSGRGSAQWRQAAWRVPSRHFTAPCLALTHCAMRSTDRIFTPGWAPHHCRREPVLKSLWDFFFFFFVVQASQGDLHLFQSWRFYRSIQSGGHRRRHRGFSSSSPSSSSSSFCVSDSNSPNSSSALCRDNPFALGNNQIDPENRSRWSDQKLGLFSRSRDTKMLGRRSAEAKILRRSFGSVDAI